MEIESSEIETVSSETLKFIRKRQVGNDYSLLPDENFFLSPPVYIKLKNPKIIEINSKYIVFKYDDSEENTLKELSNNIIKSFKNEMLLDESTIVNPICTQYIRCNLPIPWSPYKKKYFKYSFDFYKNEQMCNVTSDNINSLNKENITKAVIEVKNIWRSNNKYGFNSLLKDMYSM
jgi:hypothetical protein